MTDFDEEFMNGLYREEKVLDEDVVWEQDPANRARYSMRTRVLTVDGGEVLSVCGEYWPKGYSFVLRYQNVPIRLWDFNDHHEDISGGHKHRYTSGGGLSDDPYGVDDVSTSDVNQALIDFLAESTIKKADATIHEITGLDKYG